MIKDHMDAFFRHRRLMTECTLRHGAGFRLVFEVAQEAGFFRDRHVRSLNDLGMA